MEQLTKTIRKRYLSYKSYIIEFFPILINNLHRFTILGLPLYICNGRSSDFNC